MEFGTRRAQEMDAAIWGTRAAFIGGASATSNVRAGKIFGIPVAGTHAHALVQTYGDDYKAFKAYAETHHDCVFLVDTYDTLRIGVPAAIKVAKEMGDKINFKGVRIDSGDMAYISKKVRQQLDDAGFTDAKIYASNDLDENTILNLKMQKAKLMSGELVPNSSPPTTNQLWALSTRLYPSKMKMEICVTPSSCLLMRKKSPLLVRNRFGASPPKKKENQKGTTSPLRTLTSHRWIISICSIQLTPISIKPSRTLMPVLS